MKKNEIKKRKSNKIKEKRKNNKKEERIKKRESKQKQKAISTLAGYSSLRGSRRVANLYWRMDGGWMDGGGGGRVTEIEKNHVF